MIAVGLLLVSAAQITRGTVVVEPATLSSTPVYARPNTDSSAQLIGATIEGRDSTAVRVNVGEPSEETNAVQLGLPSSAPVKAGDTMLARFYVRGTRASGSAHIQFSFAQTTDPWTTSVVSGLDVTPGWREIVVPFSASIDYPAGKAMASFRFAFGPQTIELSDPEVQDLGASISFEALAERLQKPRGMVRMSFDVKHPQQTMVGFGGDFPLAVYGGTEAFDSVGEYVIDHLQVAHARVGLPLDFWAPSPGRFQLEGPAQASMETLANLAKRRIPTVLSIWRGPTWMLGGKPGESGRELPKDQYDACIDAIAQFLITAKSKFGVAVDYLSLNEPDSGVNFKFSSRTMRDFIRRAGPHFAALGLKTKFLVGDTGGGAEFVNYATPIVEDPTITQYLGPIAFHCWDALFAPDADYSAIRQFGERFKKPVWCLETGHDSGLWREDGDPWGTWDNALRTAMAYAKTLQLTGASVMDYWTYEDNYPLVDHKNNAPYPVFDVIQQMQAVFAPGRRVVLSRPTQAQLVAIGTIGRAGDLSVLLVNSGGVGQAKLDGFAPRSKFRVLVRTKAGGTTSTLVSSKAGDLTVSLPIRSVVSILPAD